MQTHGTLRAVLDNVPGDRDVSNCLIKMDAASETRRCPLAITTRTSNRLRNPVVDDAGTDGRVSARVDRATVFGLKIRALNAV